ncbi:MAG: segregation/condensation protein A [Candidatus Omnitrophica bacterium]|nr:segregation/condensation protein A [Candidatus Omnitrophota bacterium]
MSYKIKLDIFEGPLDLLLFLIKKNDIDICNIPIVKVTDQYIEYIEMMKMLDLEVVGEFLVMAATLLQIKSRMLLPPDPSGLEQEEIDPRDELVQRLQEYRVFKEIAEQLKGKEGERQNFFSRQIDEEARKEMENDAKEVYFEANLFDLINAFSAALSKVKEDKTYEVSKEEFTVEQKIHDILHTLLKNNSMLLTEIFAAARSKVEMIVSFMAILELIRLKEVLVVQKRLFSDIEVMRNRENVIPAQSGPSAEQAEPEEATSSSASAVEEPPQTQIEETSEVQNPPSQEANPEENQNA